MTAKALMGEEMPEDVVNASIELVKKQGGSLLHRQDQRVLSYFISSVRYFHHGSHAGEDPRTEVCIRYCTGTSQEKACRRNQSVVRGYHVCKIHEMTKEAY